MLRGGDALASRRRPRRARRRRRRSADGGALRATRRACRAAPTISATAIRRSRCATARCASRRTTCSRGCCAGWARPSTRCARRSSPRRARTRAGHHHHSGDAKHSGIIHDMIDARDAPVTASLRSCACCSSQVPALPIGAYSYSQGLEWAVEAGGDPRCRGRASVDRRHARLRDRAAAKRPSLCACASVARDGDWDALRAWHAWFRASRETAELRRRNAADGRRAREASARSRARRRRAPANDARDRAAYAARRRSRSQRVHVARRARCRRRLPLVVARKPGAGGDQGWCRSARSPASGCCSRSARRSRPSSQRAQAMDDDDLGSFAPGLALASARHETQYTRLFRS